VDALLISPGSDLRYLLGVGGSSYERLTCLVVPAGGSPTLVVPKLELPGYADVPTDDLGITIETWVDGDDPYELAYRAFGTRPQRIAVADTMTALHVLGLRAGRRMPSRCWPVRCCVNCGCARTTPSWPRCAGPARRSTGARPDGGVAARRADRGPGRRGHRRRHRGRGAC